MFALRLQHFLKIAFSRTKDFHTLYMAAFCFFLRNLLMRSGSDVQIFIGSKGIDKILSIVATGVAGTKSAYRTEIFGAD